MSDLDEYASRRAADAKHAWLEQRIQEAVLAERERCATVCEGFRDPVHGVSLPVAQQCAAAIRQG